MDRRAFNSAAAGAAAAAWLPGAARAAEYYEGYDLKPDPTRVTLAVQPLAYPLAFISSVMLRDRVLRNELKRQGVTLRSYSFKKGNDIFSVAAGGGVSMAMVGDMPTINIIAVTPTVIAGLGKRNFSSIVSKNYARLEELRGKKLGYSAGSSSHLVLLRGLKAAKLTEQDVQLVPIELTQMPDALESGAVDAFSAWEPTPSMSLARDPKNRAIYRGMSTDWVVMSRDLTLKRPEVALAMVASYARAINWMRRSKGDIERAAQWVLADGQALLGQMPAITAAKAIEIARKDLLDVPGAPAMPAQVDGAPPLSREFAFLKERGVLPATMTEDAIRIAFAYSGLKQVNLEPKKYRLGEFDYDS